LTLKQVDDFLDELTTVTKEDDQLRVLQKLLKKATPQDFRWIVKLIDKDLKINIGAKFALGALHPKLYDAYKASNDLKMIISRFEKHELDTEKASSSSSSSSSSSGLTKAESLITSTTLMTPVKPMLAKFELSLDLSLDLSLFISPLIPLS